jgi:hypothetical protein
VEIDSLGSVISNIIPTRTMSISSKQVWFVPKLDESKGDSTSHYTTLGGRLAESVEDCLELGSGEREIASAKVESPCHGRSRGKEFREGVEGFAHCNVLPLVRALVGFVVY